MTLVLVIVLAVWRQRAVQFAHDSVTFLQQVRGEVRKITWPTWDDLRRSTIVITVLVIVIGLVIGIMDWVFAKLLIDFLGRAIG